MFKIEIKLPDNLLEKEIDEFESQRVQVGVLDKAKMASIPRSRKKGLSRIKGTSYPRRKIHKKSKILTVTKLAEYMDEYYGFISDAPLVPSNTDLIKVTNELIKIFNGDLDPRRVENAAIAIIRNPIIRMDYGRNAASTEKEKGFNRPLVDSATLFNNITAKYYIKGG